jgi:hydrogenase 3 maturation protease
VGGVAPENLTGEIKRFKPELLLIIDALDMGLEPGEVRIISVDEIDGVSFSTHILPLPIIMDYLAREIGCETLLLGIQITSLEFMADMTPAVAIATDALTTELRELLQ